MAYEKADGVFVNLVNAVPGGWHSISVRWVRRHVPAFCFDHDEGGIEEALWLGRSGSSWESTSTPGIGYPLVLAIDEE
jgi:hypothetical protein